MKTHQGAKKRFKITNPKEKNKRPKVVRQTKRQGSRHLRTKMSNKRKNRLNQPVVKKKKKRIKKLIVE